MILKQVLNYKIRILMMRKLNLIKTWTNGILHLDNDHT